MNEDVMTMPLQFPIRSIPAKRVFDILFSLGALIILSPILMIIAIAIRFSSKKIFFSHERVGRGGRTFRCYKFCSMYPNAEQILKELLSSSPSLKEEWDQTFKLKNDPRITPIGAFIRKTSLDELPQFWNVLIGDLSVVGPRPVVKAEVVKHFGASAPKILSIRPGLTGIWQVSGRSNTSYADRIHMDLQYIESHSLLLDLKLIAKTFPAMIWPNGAY